MGVCVKVWCGCLCVCEGVWVSVCEGVVLVSVCV